jgi:hypothetical protein
VPVRTCRLSKGQYGIFSDNQLLAGGGEGSERGGEREAGGGVGGLGERRLSDRAHGESLDTQGEARGGELGRGWLGAEIGAASGGGNLSVVAGGEGAEEVARGEREMEEWGRRWGQRGGVVEGGGGADDARLELLLLANRLQERWQWLAAARNAAPGPSRAHGDVRTVLLGILLFVRRSSVALIDLVGLDMLGDEGWVVLLGLLGILLAAPAAMVSSASSVPMYDASGWLQVWRVKLPLGAYFLLAFALSLRAAKHIKASRSQKYSL